MRAYIDSIFIGLGIASFLLVLNAVNYFGGKTLLVILLMGVAQGLIVPAIYRERLGLPYLGKFLIHAGGSYLLVLISALLLQGIIPLLPMSISWLIVFSLVFLYFYRCNHRMARDINEKLKEMQK
ncbi:DUF3021 family protein [Lactococcus nasutitermitis]|uniref:DUF3021 family protein n=1 Tax=Lactococcus nasutitermitis TaxID=1652957 RepID=A0ABV9JAB0_9LACT|nr:DUF3021 family protein [Lactococcus nasutitermitis]